MSLHQSDLHVGYLVKLCKLHEPGPVQPHARGPCEGRRALASPPNSSAFDNIGRIFRTDTSGGMSGMAVPIRLKNVSCKVHTASHACVHALWLVRCMV